MVSVSSHLHPLILLLCQMHFKLFLYFFGWGRIHRKCSSLVWHVVLNINEQYLSKKPRFQLAPKYLGMLDSDSELCVAAGFYSKPQAEKES